MPPFYRRLYASALAALCYRIIRLFMRLSDKRVAKSVEALIVIAERLSAHEDVIADMETVASVFRDEPELAAVCRRGMEEARPRQVHFFLRGLFLYDIVR